MTYGRYKVLIVGGPDVHQRLGLMNCLRNDFDISAAGSSREIALRFAGAGFNFYSYNLERRVRPLLDMVTLWQLCRLLRHVQPHVVHTFDTKPGVWGRLAGRLARVPVVIGTLPGLGSLYSDNALPTRLTRSIYQPLQKVCCYLSDFTVFQNQQDMEEFTAAGVSPAGKSALILGSGVSTDVFDPVKISELQRQATRKELGISGNELVVTMIARLTRSKGVLDFAAAAKIVHEHSPGTRFLLVGPLDREVPDCLTADELSRVQEAVHWRGSRADIAAVLSISDIFVLASAYREGIPRVLLEAASMSLPLIATDMPGCNEVVADGENGFLVQVRDTNMLASAIQSLIVQPELRRKFGSASRERVITSYGLSLVAAETRSLYFKALAQKGFGGQLRHNKLDEQRRI